MTVCVCRARLRAALLHVPVSVDVEGRGLEEGSASMLNEDQEDLLQRLDAWLRAYALCRFGEHHSLPPRTGSFLEAYAMIVWFQTLRDNAVKKEEVRPRFLEIMASGVRDAAEDGTMEPEDADEFLARIAACAPGFDPRDVSAEQWAVLRATVCHAHAAHAQGAPRFREAARAVASSSV